MSDHGIETEPGTVRFERMLPGPIERVWAYLTEADKRAKWLAGGPMDLRPGGEVRLSFCNSELSSRHEDPPEKYAGHGRFETLGHVVRCDPPRLLTYSWNERGDDASEVTFELNPHDELVQLVLTHKRLAGRTAKVSVAGGWHTHLGILADQLEGRDPPGFWSTHARLEAEYEARLTAA